MVATLLYGLIQQDGLLADVEMPVWQEAAEVTEEMIRTGEAESRKQYGRRGMLRRFHSAVWVQLIDLDVFLEVL